MALSNAMVSGPRLVVLYCASGRLAVCRRLLLCLCTRLVSASPPLSAFNDYEAFAQPPPPPAEPPTPPALHTNFETGDGQASLKPKVSALRILLPQRFQTVTAGSLQVVQWQGGSGAGGQVVFSLQQVRDAHTHTQPMKRP